MLPSLLHRQGEIAGNVPSSRTSARRSSAPESKEAPQEETLRLHQGGVAPWSLLGCRKFVRVVPAPEDFPAAATRDTTGLCRKWPEFRRSSNRRRLHAAYAFAVASDGTILRA